MLDKMTIPMAIWLLENPKLLDKHPEILKDLQTRKNILREQRKTFSPIWLKNKFKEFEKQWKAQSVSSQVLLGPTTGLQQQGSLSTPPLSGIVARAIHTGATLDQSGKATPPTS